nr:acyl carrier protein [Pseudomonas typographi]
MAIEYLSDSFPAEPAVYAIIAGHFRVPLDTVAASTRLVYDLGADSSELLELCVLLSEQYRCELDTDLVGRLRTAGDVYQMLCQAFAVPAR